MKIKKIIVKLLICSLVLSFFQWPAKIRAAAKLQKVAVNNLGLVGRWSFDGSDTTWTSATAGTTADTSGQGNTGTLTSMNRASSPSLGKIGQSFYFDGTNDYVSLASDPVGTNTVTVCAWFKTSSFSAWQNISANGNFTFYINTDAKVYISSIGGGSPVVSAGTASLNTWTHTCVIRLSDGTATVFLNGSQSGSSGSSGTPASGFGLGIGDRGYGTSNPFLGNIDEFRIYNRALSPSEISQMYSSGKFTFAASYRNALTNGLVGLWTLDGADTSWSGASSGTVYDRSGQGNNGTMNNLTQNGSGRVGVIGQALSLEQANDNINMGNVTVLNGQSAATWSFWLYQTSYQSGGYYLSKDDPNIGAQESWAIFNENTSWAGTQDDIGVRVSSSLGSGIDLCIAQDADITLNQWMLVTVVFDGAQTGNQNRIKIYTNGVKRTLTGGDCSGTIPSSITNSSASVVVGNSTDNIKNVDVAMDDIRIYNRALSDSEIKQLYNMGGSKFNASQNNSLTNGLVGLWSFNGQDYNAASTTAEVLDRSGQGNNGDAQNGPARTIGKVGQALSFDKANTLVDISGLSLDTGAKTFSAWIYPRGRGEGDFGTIFFATEGGGTMAHFAIVTDYLSFSNDGATYAAASSAITYNTWQHVVAVRNSSGTVSLYINGSLNGSANQAAGTQSFTATNNTIGARYDSIYTFDGLIDEVRVYNRALSAGEIKQLYNMGR